MTPATTAATIARRRKYSASSAFVEAVRVPDEVHRRQVRAHGDREQPADDRRGVDPTRPRVAGLAAGRDPAGRDRARDRAHAVRARAPTTSANAAPKLRRSRVRNTALRNAKLDPRSTIPSAASVSGTNSVSVIDANASENAGPQHDEAEDQPDVVRLPHRADRVVDQRARPFAPLGAAGDEVPEPGAEVGAAEERVRGDAEEQHHGGRVRRFIRPAPPRGVSSPRMPGSLGPYGTSDSSTLARPRASGGSCRAARGSW